MWNQKYTCSVSSVMVMNSHTHTHTHTHGCVEKNRKKYTRISTTITPADRIMLFFSLWCLVCFKCSGSEHYYLNNQFYKTKSKWTEKKQQLYRRPYNVSVRNCVTFILTQRISMEPKFQVMLIMLHFL